MEGTQIPRVTGVERDGRDLPRRSWPRWRPLRGVPHLLSPEGEWKAVCFSGQNQLLNSLWRFSLLQPHSDRLGDGPCTSSSPTRIREGAVRITPSQ